MKYYSPTENDKYKTIINPTFKKDIIPKLQIGDILITKGHAALIYDLVKDDEGNVIDAIIIHSGRGIGRSFVNSKIHRNTAVLPSGEVFSSSIFRLFLNSK